MIKRGRGLGRGLHQVQPHLHSNTTCKRSTRSQPQIFPHREPQIRSHVLTQTQTHSQPHIQANSQLHNNTPYDNTQPNHHFPIEANSQHHDQTQLQYQSGSSDSGTQNQEDSLGANHSTSESNGASNNVQRRGPTRCKKLATMEPHEKLKVELENGRAVGPNSQEFTTQVAVWVKQTNHFPLQVNEWSDISEETRNKFWEFIQEKFEVYPITEKNKKKIFMWLGERWRQRRCTLKNKCYSKFKTDEERLQHRPRDVNTSDWEYLVKLFGTNDFKVKSERNTRNKRKSGMSHTAGSLSFVRRRRAIKDRTGAEPNILDFFRETHTKKNKTAVNETLAQMFDKIDDLNTQVEEGSCTLTETEIFRCVVGRDTRGRCKGYGMGPTPTEIYGSHESRSREEFLEKQLEEQRSKYENIIATMQEQIDGISNGVQTQVVAQLDAFMRQHMSVLTSSAPHGQPHNRG